MLTKGRILIIILAGYFLFPDIQAQNNTYSPYSRFGIGDISRNVLARNQALGGIGIGLRDPNHINYVNPAAGAAQDSMSFMFSTGITGNAMNLASSQGSHNVSNITLSHLALAFPVNRWWRAGFGLVPYSQMGYNIVDVELVQGAEHFYEGTGGINQFYFGNSIRLGPWFSAGVNVSYLFGSLTRTSSLRFTAGDDKFPVNVRTSDMVGDFHFRYGLQHHNRIGNRYSYTLGVIFENKTNLSTDHEKLIIREFTTGAGHVRDTISHTTGNRDNIELPANIGVGASFSRDNRFMIGADYSIQQWAETSFMGQHEESLVNSSSLNIGVQYVPGHADFRNYLNRIHYRLGFHHSNSYLELRGHQLTDQGITFGLGLPYRNTNTTFNFSVNLGRRGTTENNLIRENYVVFNFSLSLFDYWFFQRRFD
jgi:hypothetical protein